MEGHESSDWNSYYADTQEVRDGQRAGQSGGSCRGRPGETDAGPGGRPAGWDAASVPPLPAHPVWPRPDLGGASEPNHCPARGAGTRRPALGTGERISGYSGL